MARPLEFVHTDLSDGAHSGRAAGTKRTKYTPHACQACKRRKVKCSGHEPCRNCESRGLACVYVVEPSSSMPSYDTSPARTVSAPAQTNYNPVNRESQLSASRTPPRTPSTDPRFEELCVRVKSLERKMNHILDAPKNDNDDESPPPVVQPNERPGFDGDEEDNTFVRNTGPNEDMSLSSHVAAMRALLSRPSSPQQKSPIKPNSRSEMLISLPEPPRLQYLLEVYFNEMECYYPFLDRYELEPRIYEVIRSLGYASSCFVVLVPLERLSVLGLTCVMLALAECLDSQEGAYDKESRPGWSMYLQGCRASRRSFHARIIDLDTVRAQVIIAGYLIQLELLLGASHTISVAFQLAASLRLHNENSWPKLNPAEVLSRKQLWWNMFTMERRIAQKCGATYHIKESEFSVSDFRDDPAAATSMDLAYLQAMINISRLWGHVWDSLFAVSAIIKSQEEIASTVEVIDQQILNMRRQLPPDLTWECAQSIRYIDSEDSVRHLRRCLLLYTRLELLRMLIRQNLLRPGPFQPETAHHCARLAREVIHALGNYVARYPLKRAFGYFCTASTVECAYHLIPVLRFSNNQLEQAASMAALQQARGILEQLEAKLNIAKKSLQALQGVLTRWGGGDAVVAQGIGTPHSLEARSERDPMGPLQPAGFDPAFPAGLHSELSLDEWLSLPMGQSFGGDFDFLSGP